MAGITLWIVALLVGLASVFFLKSRLSGTKEEDVFVPDEGESATNFVDRLQAQKKRLVIFYGSQTGTAEEYAIRIAREAKARYGTSPLVIDPESEEMDKLDLVPEDCAVVFVMATYGEGEPTDNAVPMMEFLKSSDVAFTNGSTLENLHYVAFGLGNRTYEYFNETIRQLDDRLQQLGAHRIGERGEGDDEKGLEEDYLAWKDGMFEALASTLGLEEGATGDVSDYVVTELDEVPERVYHGEYHPRGLSGMVGNHDARNPYPSQVMESHELFASGVASRTCTHLEFDIKDTGMSYQHGDHLGVWPCNPEPQVDRALAVLGLLEKRDQVIHIKSLDPTLAKVPFPIPTTYEAVMRYYLDINALASRQALATFAPFAPSDAAREELERIGKDRDYFKERVADHGYRVAQVLQLVAGDSLLDDDIAKTTKWNLSFDRVISAIPRLTPRYYSISSSPKLSPDRIHITVVGLRYTPPSATMDVFGLASNFLSSVNMVRHGETPLLEDPRHGTPLYQLEGPSGKYKSTGEQDETVLRVPIHVRRSTFRLPTSTKVPIIMIGPGTGVAPFRSFVQERVATARKAKAKLGEDALQDWSDLRLYYGCRRRNEDFLYHDEWDKYAAELDGKLKLRLSFSREVFKPDGSKLYVQDLIWEDREALANAILNKRAYIYICGEGKGMCHDVESTLSKILGQAKGGDEELGRAELKLLKERNRMMLDVWS
ncbi:NADPH-hemoprotein reductase [Malassezia pachydermatis]|uniref:NADPH--cytochrome P450 reductase n=1 Tax=Malassezia pachydermatis TaxID=77020 RepID=A0A0M8MWE5_9BASI|nr:cytochrome p450 oxidoreductase [Malassezia pachydermatis]KOS15130.1 cytochrome p450 oxidoreductase [Malassezia pachydermatis]